VAKTLEEAKLQAFEITKNFEGGKGYCTLAGNRDGQIISFGFIQFAAGQGKLQPVIKAMNKRNPELFSKCCTVYVNFYKKKVDLSKPLLIACDAPISGFRAYFTDPSRQNPKTFRLAPHWEELFTNLGKEPEFQAVQREFAKPYMDRAIDYCKKYKFVTERAVALMLDICVQMGSLSAGTRARYFAATAGRVITEQTRLIKLAEAVSKQANPRWQADVLSRKMCISRGVGTVHGRRYDLKKEFNLGDEQAL